jgi:hypothetical protein
LEAQVALKSTNDLLLLIFPEQAVIDEDAVEAISKSFTAQRCSHGAVNAATERANGVRLVTYLATNGLHLLFQCTLKAPAARGMRNIEEKRTESFGAFRCVSNFWMILQSEDCSTFRVVDALDGYDGVSREGGGGTSERRRERDHLVPMRHPDLLLSAAASKEAAGRGDNGGDAVFAGLSSANRSAEKMNKALHAIADAQYRHALGIAAP